MKDASRHMLQSLASELTQRDKRYPDDNFLRTQTRQANHRRLAR